jgi:phenylacetate-CoA ligase
MKGVILAVALLPEGADPVNSTLRHPAMAHFHLRTLPGYTWPPLADMALSQVWVAYQELDRIQWLPSAEIEQQQLEQVRVLLSHAIAYVPYYRELLPKAGITPGSIQSMADFRRIPLLPRRTYQEKNASFAATRLPAGTVATNTRQTSGSSGTPTTVFQTNLVHLWWHAFFLRDLEWSGIDPTGTLAAIRSTGKKGKDLEQLMLGVSQPCWLAELDPLIATGLSYIMDIQQDQRIQMGWLRRIEPDYLITYPSNLETLAQLVRQDGPLPSLKAIQSISETLTDEARADLEAAFGIPVRNTYSCAEAGYLASPCPDGHGLHVHAENVILEVLGENDHPCQAGETGRVYVTHLHNSRGPFIRYELGDEATVGPKSCPCGRGLLLLATVQGKSYPLFHLCDGSQKNSVTLARLVRKVGGHWQHQVIQKGVDHVVIRLAVDGTWTPAHADNLRQSVQNFFGAPIRVDVEIHDRLAVPAHGKFQSMINEIKPSAGNGA